MAISDEKLRQIEAAENIKMVSQQIVKAYFYLHQDIRVEQSEKNLKNGLTALSKDVKILTKTKDVEQKNMVMFMSFTMDEIKETVSKPYNKERGALMLDYSETLLEGAEFLLTKHNFKQGDKELKMLIVSEEMAFLLERTTKYYIAFKDGFTDHNNVKQLEQAVAEFEINLKKIKTYSYPDNLKGEVKKIVKYWPIAKKFYLGVEDSDLPLIVSITTQHLEKSIKKLERYHHKKAKDE
jgi:hypothetical protein